MRFLTSADFWQRVRAHLEAGSAVFAALVVGNTRGSPGTRGARLYVAADGAIGGTVGGGIMEAGIVRDARAGLRAGTDAPPRLQHFEHRNKPGTKHPSGLICAGEQTNLNLWLQPRRDLAAIDRFCRASADQDGPAATLVVDAKGLGVIDGGGQSGMQLRRDGDHWRYTESSRNPLRLAIAGGGHCGKALARLACELGYRVQVFDTRGEMLQTDDWPAAVDRQRIDDYAKLGGHLHHPERTAVVVMTTAITSDIAALASVAETDWRWLGVMGSRAKIHEIHTALAVRGIAQPHIDAIHGPIGLPMKSDTPPEIAVSIMAQLLDLRAS